MNLVQVYELLTSVGAVSARTTKEALLGPSLVTSPLFRIVCQCAYDPFRTYGLTWDPASQHPFTDENEDQAQPQEMFSLLDRLACRDLTGNAAREAVLAMLGRLTYRSGDVLIRILNKDLRAGFTATTLNKLHKGLIPEFSCMLAHKFEAKRVKQWPVAVEPKLDGVRLLARVEGGKVQLLSRNGKSEFADMPLVVASLVALGVDGWFDGEVTVPGGFNETVSQVRTKDAVLEHAVYTVFEYLTFHEFEVNSGPLTYADRINRLNEVFSTGPKGDHYGTCIGAIEGSYLKMSPVLFAHTEGEVHALYENMLAQGLEGVIVKPLSGVYIKKRSHDWMKIKAEETLDLKVVGAFEGEGKYFGMLGGLIVDHKGVEVRVGGGFTDQQRIDLWKAFHLDTLDELSDLAFEPKLLGKVIEVMYHEVTPDGSLRHPRFKCFRFDKETV